MRAGTHESHQPAPLLEIGAGTKVNRRIPSQKPFRQFRKHAWASQWSDVAIGKLASVGEAGLARNIVVALYDRDLMPVGPQIPGRGEPDNTGSEYDNMHGHTKAPEEQAATFFNFPKGVQYRSADRI